jgi:hypothetical protein
VLTIVLGDSDWFELLGIGFFGDVGGDGREAIGVVVVVVHAGTGPSSCFDNTPCAASFILIFYLRSIVGAS